MTRSFLWGRRHASASFDRHAARRLCLEAERRRKGVRDLNAWEAIRVLERTGRLWQNPASPWRRKAQALMPRTSGFSAEMVRRTLEILPRLLDRNSLRRRLAAELGREDALDAWSLDPERRGAVKAFPLGSVLHVAAGNIFLGCIDSVLMSLLTRNVTILRMSSADLQFPFLFAESLRSADPDADLTSRLAVVSWEKGTEAIENVFKQNLQGIVVWGGDSAVTAYRRGLSAGCKLIAFGPKISFGVISREALRRQGAKEAARRAAQDIVWWDQTACAAPQALFVQDPAPDEFLRLLAVHLDQCGRSLPAGRLEPDEAAEILQERQRILAAELMGDSRLIAPRDMGWTVAWRGHSDLRPSPLHRYIHVHPYTDLEHLREQIRPWSPYLQTAGIWTGAKETDIYAEALAQMGATRIPRLGHMLESQTGEPHDGRYPMAELVRWVSGPADTVAADAPRALSRVLAQAAAESPFYRKRLKTARPGPLKLAKSPLLDKNDLYRNSPPRSEAILTREGAAQGRVLFASGGSTGEPKFCLYTQDEFDKTCRWLAWSMRRSGLEPGDVLANLFVAGNLWSSFLAVSGAARDLQVTHLPIAGTSDPAFMLETIERFRANALIGLPSMLLDLARNAEKAGKRLRIDKIFYGGEHVSREMAGYWKKAFGVRTVRSAGYASVDAGLIGFQCPSCEEGIHHVALGAQHVEILSVRTARPVGAGESGEIVVTNLLRRWMPVVRYRTGDLGRWLPGPCPCGHPAPRFALLGRCDDRINIGGAHLDLGDVGRAVASVSGLSLVYQTVVSNKDGGELTIRAERRTAAAPTSALEKKMISALLRHSEELRDSVNRGWLKTPHVEILPPGTLPRHPRTGKIRRVVDLRR